MSFRYAAQIMVRTTASTVSTHNVSVVRVQDETICAIMGAAHSHFIATPKQIMVLACPFRTILGSCIELRYVTHRTWVGIAAAFLCTAFIDRGVINGACFSFAQNVTGGGFVQPVSWALIFCAISIPVAASIQVVRSALFLFARQVLRVVTLAVLGCWTSVTGTSSHLLATHLSINSRASPARAKQLQVVLLVSIPRGAIEVTAILLLDAALLPLGCIAMVRITIEGVSILPVLGVSWAFIGPTTALFSAASLCVCICAFFALAVQRYTIGFVDHVWRADISAAQSIPVAAQWHVPVLAQNISTMDTSCCFLVTIRRGARVSRAHSLDGAAVLIACSPTVCFQTHECSCLGLLTVCSRASESSAKSSLHATTSMVGDVIARQASTKNL